MSIEDEINEGISKCLVARGNQSFFAKKDADAGEALRPAFELLQYVDDKVARIAALRRHHTFQSYERVTNNVALLVVKLVLQPEDKADERLCSDYARVLKFAADTGHTADQFVALFATGKFKETLRQAREADPKRKDSSRHKTTVAGPVICLVWRRPNSAQTVLRTVPLADGVDLNDPRVLSQLINELLDGAALDAGGKQLVDETEDT